MFHRNRHVLTESPETELLKGLVLTELSETELLNRLFLADPSETELLNRLVLTDPTETVLLNRRFQTDPQKTEPAEVTYHVAFDCDLGLWKTACYPDLQVV